MSSIGVDLVRQKSPPTVSYYCVLHCVRSLKTQFPADGVGWFQFLCASSTVHRRLGHEMKTQEVQWRTTGGKISFFESIFRQNLNQFPFCDKFLMPHVAIFIRFLRQYERIFSNLSKRTLKRERITLEFFECEKWYVNNREVDSDASGADWNVFPCVGVELWGEVLE